MTLLSNLVVTTQKFVLIIDEQSQDKLANKLIGKLLREQGQEESSIKTLKLDAELNAVATFDAFVRECGAQKEQRWNVLMPTLSDLCVYQRPAVLFQFINKLKKCPQVARTFLWLSTQNLTAEDAYFLSAYFEYMSDLVLHLQSASALSIVTRKSGGAVTNKRYACQRSRTQFMVEPAKSIEKEAQPVSEKPEQLGTFKIELEEDELMARNAMKLPYEKTSESTEGNIIYTPDAEDDFDDEDPDEDLCI